jgi:hypothetical protein
VTAAFLGNPLRQTRVSVASGLIEDRAGHGYVALSRGAKGPMMLMVATKLLAPKNQSPSRKRVNESWGVTGHRNR